MNKSVSIIIPAYNEAERIASSLAQIASFARGYGGIIEILVVDDGSTDATARVVTEVGQRHEPGQPEVLLVQHTTNSGKGASIRTGFRAARGDIVLFTDADLSAPITEMPLLIDPIVAGACDIAIGSRAADPSRIELQQGPFRQIAGRIFNIMVRMVAGLDLLDTQCGFKAFRRAPMLPIFELQRIDGFAFDVELLYIAARRGLRIRELPVRWAHAPGSKVSMLVHTWEMAIDLVRIRLNDWTGKYVPQREAAGIS